MPRVTSQQRKRAQLAELHAEGLSARKIAERIGVSRQTVSRWAKADGLKFDRAQTKAATAAITADLQKMRAELAHLALVKARGFLEALDKPFLAFNFGGKDNTYAEQLLDRPPTGDIRNLMTSFGIATQRSLELSRFDQDPGAGAADVDAWLDHMAGK